FVGAAGSRRAFTVNARVHGGSADRGEAENSQGFLSRQFRRASFREIERRRIGRRETARSLAARILYFEQRAGNETRTPGEYGRLFPARYGLNPSPPSRSRRLARPGR